jgi:coiled-coil domain-containing protein 12
VSFRNYAPKDKELGGEGLGNDDGEGPETKRQRVEEEPSRSTSSALQEALKEAKDDVTSMILQGKSPRDAIATPKKLNWDLKRDIQDKLNKLEKRTQKALVEMLKERLENEATEQANNEDSNLD